MKKNLLIPIFLLATTPFIVSCTKKSTDMPSPSPVTGTTETLTPVAPVPEVLSGTINTGTINTGAMMTPITFTRTETVSYDSYSPDGMVEIEFSATVTDGIITSASAIQKTEKQGSAYNQSNFIKDLSGKVVGKKAKDLDVDAIGGASLTTEAFETFVHSF